MTGPGGYHNVGRVAGYSYDVSGFDFIPLAEWLRRVDRGGLAEALESLSQADATDAILRAVADMRRAERRPTRRRDRDARGRFLPVEPPEPPSRLDVYNTSLAEAPYAGPRFDRRWLVGCADFADIWVPRAKNVAPLHVEVGRTPKGKYLIHDLGEAASLLHDHEGYPVVLAGGLWMDLHVGDVILFDYYHETPKPRLTWTAELAGEK